MDRACVRWKRYGANEFLTTDQKVRSSNLFGRAILRARNKIAAAVSTLNGMSPQPNISRENRELMNKLHVVLGATNQMDNSDPSRNDVLSAEIEEAKEKLTRALRPYLAEPRFLNVFKLGA